MSVGRVIERALKEKEELRTLLRDAKRALEKVPIDEMVEVIRSCREER